MCHLSFLAPYLPSALGSVFSKPRTGSVACPAPLLPGVFPTPSSSPPLRTALQGTPSPRLHERLLRMAGNRYVRAESLATHHLKLTGLKQHQVLTSKLILEVQSPKQVAPGQNQAVPALVSSGGSGENLCLAFSSF